jgi:hypothetical protein
MAIGTMVLMFQVSGLCSVAVLLMNAEIPEDVVSMAAPPASEATRNRDRDKFILG